MTAAAALARLDAVGVRVRLRQDGSLNLAAAMPPPPDVLALARAHRDGIAALLAGREQQAARAGFATLPGVPPGWCEGVARLATLPAPDSIPPARWAVLTTTAARLLRDHGPELHAAGWTDVDLFGLHATTPAANPSGWGLAWLLGTHGEVLDISAQAVGLRQGPDGARLTYRRRSAMARAGVIPAWAL